MKTSSTPRGHDTTGSTVFGMFPTRADAEGAVEALERAGFERDRISVALRHDESVHTIDAESTGEAAEGAAAGAVSGGVVGGTVGLLAGLGVVAIPGIGPALAAGWLASTLLGAGVGAAAGGLIGGLVGMGIPEEDARRFESTFRQGGVLVAVETGARASEAAAILQTYSADVSGGRAGASRGRPVDAAGSSAPARELGSDELKPHGDKLGFTGRDRRRRTAAGSYTGPERRQVQI